MDDASSSPATRAPRTSRRAAALGVAFLLVASLALRWFGLGCQLPQFVPVDSLVLASEVEVLRHGGDTSYRLWPNLYPRLIPELVRLFPAGSPDDPAPQTLEEHLARARAPYIRVGIVVALLSVLIVPGTYLLARRFLERPWALVASALAGTSVLHLWFSQQGRPHGAAASVFLLAVLAALRLRRKPVVSSYILAGIALGAAIGILQSGVATGLPFAAAFLLRSRAPGRTPASLRPASLRPRARASPWWVLLSLALAGVLVLALYPTMKGTPDWRGAHPSALALRGSVLILMGHAISLTSFVGGGFETVSQALWSYDPVIAATSALGVSVLVAVLLRRSRSREETAASPDVRRDLLVVLAFAVPYAAAIGLYSFSGQRFLLPLLPYLACAAAYGLRASSRFAARLGHLPRLAATALVAAVLGIQALGAASLSRIRSRPDTATEAATWLREHVASKSELVLLTPGFDLPLLETPEALASNAARPNLSQRWYAYQVASLPPSSVASLPASSVASERYELRTLPLSTEEERMKVLRDPAAYLRDLQATWIVVETRRLWDWRGLDAMRATLGEIGELAARFAPDDAERYDDAPIAHQGFDPRPFPIPWFRRILGARCTGSVLEIWRIRQ